MNRTSSAEKNNQDWYRGLAFSDNSRDPEFREIAQGFLCGDVTGHGTLADSQKALIRLTALTACQTWKKPFTNAHPISGLKRSSVRWTR